MRLALKTSSTIIETLLGDEDDQDLLKELGDPPTCAVPEEVLAEQKRNLLKAAIRRKEKWLGKEFQYEIDHTNRLGDRYIFGKFGRRNATTATLLWLNPQEGWKFVESLAEGEDDEDFKDVYDVKQRYLPLGSISRSTMQEEDLIPDFIAALGTVDPERAIALEEESESLAYDDLAWFCWERLTHAIERYTPPYTYFGPHAGNMSDYGVWVSQEAIDADLQYESDKIVAIRRGEPIPPNVKYVVVADENGSYVQLYSGITGELIWNDE